MRTMLAVGLALVAGPLAAATVTLQLESGAVIRGEMLLSRAGSVVVDLGFAVLEVPRDMIDLIVEGEPEGEASGNGASPVDLYLTAAGRETRSVEDNLERVAEAVVQVRTPAGLGSGFVIHPDGYVVTNQHVISGENRLAVTVFRQRGGDLERLEFNTVRIVATSPAEDLALLLIENTGGERFATVPLGDSGRLRQGQTVFAVGSPLGMDRSVSRGIVSLTNRVVNSALFIQTTTAINPGNSGGPLFDLRGEVVGVSNLKMAGFGLEGLSFAIPVETVRRFLANRSAYAFDPRNPNAGFRYHRPPDGLLAVDHPEEEP